MVEVMHETSIKFNSLTLEIMMIRTTLLAATAAVAFSISPASASGPTVLTDAELDEVVGGDTVIRPQFDSNVGGNHTVPADIVDALSRTFDCNAAIRCFLPENNSGGAGFDAVRFRDF